MIVDKKLGIWMDNASAHIIDFLDITSSKNVVESKFTHQEREHSLSKNENLMHNKEQHQQADYYKKLGEVILRYNHVILFGPTNAKSELCNSLKENHLFDNIKIHVEQSDKMTETEMQAFTQNYFSHCI
jgi:stalled ribosome rescue protein Dom34